MTDDRMIDRSGLDSLKFSLFTSPLMALKERVRASHPKHSPAPTHFHPA